MGEAPGRGWCRRRCCRCGGWTCGAPGRSGGRWWVGAQAPREGRSRRRGRVARPGARRVLVASRSSPSRRTPVRSASASAWVQSCRTPQPLAASSRDALHGGVPRWGEIEQVGPSVLGVRAPCGRSRAGRDGRPAGSPSRRRRHERIRRDRRPDEAPERATEEHREVRDIECRVGVGTYCLIEVRILMRRMSSLPSSRAVPRLRPRRGQVTGIL